MGTTTSRGLVSTPSSSSRRLAWKGEILREFARKTAADAKSRLARRAQNQDDESRASPPSEQRGRLSAQARSLTLSTLSTTQFFLTQKKKTHALEELCCTSLKKIVVRRPKLSAGASPRHTSTIVMRRKAIIALAVLVALLAAAAQAQDDGDCIPREVRPCKKPAPFPARPPLSAPPPPENPPDAGPRTFNPCLRACRRARPVCADFKRAPR